MSAKIKSILIISLLAVTPGSWATVPAQRAERTDLVDTRLSDLDLSKSAKTLLRQSPSWSKQTVSSFCLLSLEARRQLVGANAWLEREISTALRPHDLRSTLTGPELRKYVEEGRAPVLSAMSSIDVLPVTEPMRALLKRLDCATLGDVRLALWEAIMFNLKPLTPDLAAGFRELHLLELPPGEEIITQDEVELSEAFLAAKLGPAALKMIRDEKVATIEDLKALPFKALAARSQLDKKTVNQLESVLRTVCGTRLWQSDDED